MSIKEDIFGQIPGISGEDKENWYKARYYVLDVLSPLDRKGIGHGSNKHVHVIVDSTDALMLAVVRQIVLIAHYANFDENTCQNRSVLTFNVQNPTEAYKKVYESKVLGNLMDFCQCVVEDETVAYSRALPLDIRLEFASHVSYIESEDEYLTVIKENEVKSACSGYEIDTIDVHRGVLVNMVYKTGVEIDSLPACDNDNISRYAMALMVFCYKLKTKNVLAMWNESVKYDKNGNPDAISVKNKMSSIFCSDCFISHLRGMLGSREKPLMNYVDEDYDSIMDLLCQVDTIRYLAMCEHARWNVEKLIMGFRPFTIDEVYKDFNLMSQEKTAYRKSMRKRFSHVDLCSCHNLKRINPSDMKYDYFIMLAMPQIMLSQI